MDYNLIELEYSRLLSHLNLLRENHYSDKRLHFYQKSLISLFESVGEDINSTTFNSSSVDKLLKLKEVLQFIKISIECLNDSVFNLLPVETLFCIDIVLKEWEAPIKEDYEKILVVTNRYNSYFFWGYLSLNDTLFQLLEIEYGVRFEQRLILISIPKFEINDYLTNVVLYHELGHYIETKFSIVDRILKEKYKGEKLETLTKEQYYNRLKEQYHLREYFCDLFAAQYTSNSISIYLNYIAYNIDESETHPSTNNRTIVVENFINKKEDEVFLTLNNATYKTTGKNLQKRYTEFSKSDFINLIPFCIQNNGELHFLFILGWQLWINKHNEYNKFSNEKVYEIINNLIEKSISNYMIRQSWTKAKEYVFEQR